jgi:hypothetical protein
VGEYLPVVRVRSGLVAVIGLLFVAGVCGGSASGVPIVPTCVAGDFCATLTLDVPSLPAQAQPGSPIPGAPYDEGSGTVTSTDPPGLDCTYTLGIQSGVCSKYFAWPMGQSELEVIMKIVPAPGNVACFDACEYAASFGPGEVDYWPLEPGDNVGLPVGFGLARSR